VQESSCDKSDWRGSSRKITLDAQEDLRRAVKQRNAGGERTKYFLNLRQSVAERTVQGPDDL
jgi:hypothetical protein